MIDLVRQSYKVNPTKQRKKKRIDTRNSWHELLFVSHCRYKVFRKQKTIDACVEGFMQLKAYGFEFREIGFALTHVHFSVNIPKRYSIETVETMLKTWSAKNIFAKIPNFIKLYPDKHFWSGYEHHQPIGKDREQSANYIKNQSKHHNINNPLAQRTVFDFTTVPLTNFA